LIELNQKEIVDLMISKMKRLGTHTSGTYNKQDPTHFEKGDAAVSIQYGYQVDDEAESCPGPENIKIHWEDCTWGIDFTFETSCGKDTGYFDRGIGECSASKWLYCSDDFFKVFKDVLLHSKDESYFTYEEETYSDPDEEHFKRAFNTGMGH